MSIQGLIPPKGAGIDERVSPVGRDWTGANTALAEGVLLYAKRWDVLS